MDKLCRRCGCPMKGIREYRAREKCAPCGGESLTEDTPARVEARRTLAAIYAAKDQGAMRFFQ